MRHLILGLFCVLSSHAFAVENVAEFSETMMERTCNKAKVAASERARQISAGNGVYDGEIDKYKGAKVIRLIQTERACEAVYTDVGMMFRYWLTVQVQAN